MNSTLQTKVTKGISRREKRAFDHTAQSENKEKNARAVMETYVGKPLDDVTWKRMRQQLIDFVVTLERWDHQQKNTLVEDKTKCGVLNNLLV